MKKAIKYLLLFVAGQGVPIVLQILANQNYMRMPVLFCGAAGFLVAVAVYAGARLGFRDGAKDAGKTHMDDVGVKR